jgi:hypothetical protein
MSLDHSGKSHDEALSKRKEHKQRSLEQPGGDMAVEGTQADETHSCGELFDAGFFTSIADGRIGRCWKFPPQFGHTLRNVASAQTSQNVHS